MIRRNGVVIQHHFLICTIFAGERKAKGKDTDHTRAHREEGGRLRRQRRRWRGGSAASTHKGSLRRAAVATRPAAQAESDKVHAVNLLQLGCLSNGRKARETRSGNYPGKTNESGHPN